MYTKTKRSGKSLGPSVSNCVLYARSRDENPAEQAKGIRQQLTTLRRFARSKRWPIVAEFTDEGSSAMDMKRSGLVKLLAFCRKSGSVATVLVRDVDRLFRNPADGTKLYRQLVRRLGISVIFSGK